MEIVDVDGSFGEGGGQILRTAAAFSVTLRKPIHVSNIRAGRKVPGLSQQHVSALEILRAVSGGKLEGCRVGSSEVIFQPGDGSVDSMLFDLKTAASTTLVLQAVIPAAALSGRRLSLELLGGTDVPWSPTLDYLATVLREAFASIGIRFEVDVLSRGYYPRGGGRVRATIEKCEMPKELVMEEANATPRASIVSRCGSLPEHVAKRQMESAERVIASKGIKAGNAFFRREESASPGSSILVWDSTAGRVMGCDGLGAKGRSAESVGQEAGERFAAIAESNACVDPNLADMIAPILCLARGESRLRIPASTAHLVTSLHVARLFTASEYSIEPRGTSSLLRISPSPLDGGG